MTRYRRTWNRVIGLALLCTFISTTFIAAVLLAAQQTARIGEDIYLCRASKVTCLVLVPARHVLHVPADWLRR